MKYQYEIPPKLVKKNGYFGTISNYDIGMSAGLAAIGFLTMLILQNLLGMVILLLCGASAYLFFLFRLTLFCLFLFLLLSEDLHLCVFLHAFSPTLGDRREDQSYQE